MSKQGSAACSNVDGGLKQNRYSLVGVAVTMWHLHWWLAEPSTTHRKF